jgi:hypothetical protein
VNKMGRKKISTTVYLTEEQVDALKELHQRTRVPIAEYIRLGIDMVLKQHRESLPGQISLFEGLEEELESAEDKKKTDDDPDHDS